jgi:DNA-binding CsgD family transcriptional regulator
MDNKTKDISEKSESKPKTVRRERWVRLTDESWELLGVLAENSGRNRSDCLEALVQSNSQFMEMIKPSTRSSSGITGVLTKRETEVLALMVEGLNTVDISSRLCISTHTVKAYVHRLIHKFSCSNRTQVVAKAVSAGLFEPPCPIADKS